MPQFEHTEMDYLYCDIETKSHGEPDFESLKTKDELAKEIPITDKEVRKLAPKSYKNKEVVDKWVKEKIDKNKEELEIVYQKQIDDYDAAFRKKALNSLESDLVCVSLAFNDKEPTIIEYNKDEKVMLLEMDKWIKANLGMKRYAVVWVAHNIPFDILRLWHRVVKYQVEDLMDTLPIEKWSKRREDTNELFNGYFYGKYTSLDDMCRFLGLPGKGDVDGGAVHDLFLEGKLDVIYDYCMNGDVRKLRMAHRMMKGLPQLESDIENVK